MIYLDSAATSLIKPYSVSVAVTAALRTMASPGRGGHAAAMLAAQKAYETRELAAALFNMRDPGRIVYSMNATHALNTAFKSYDLYGKKVVISGWEHNSVVRPIYAAGAAITVARSPLFDKEAVVRAYRDSIDGAALAVVNHVSNVFGSILPVEEIALLCSKRGVPLVIDASQSAGILPIDSEALNADFIAMPGHKGLYGPQGIGLLLCTGNNERPHPLLYGGSGMASRSSDMPDYLPERLEAGTHNMPGICGLGAGIKYVLEKGTESLLEHERSLLRLTVEKLSSIKKIKLYCANNIDNQTGVLSFTVDGVQSEAVASALDEAGIAVRAGMHCAPLAHASAGTYESGTVRVSFCAFSTSDDVEALAYALTNICKRV
ncbi:MAG: aminotransferase class V-fold PLP-dependent enzyme [Clostridiales bacterium]|nr:aminotransferase class V-fold PLP-dependent enzyme [Clostridiales bacterium]